MSVTADLSGPSSGACGSPSTIFTITLSGVLGVNAVFTVTSSVGADTVTTSPVTIIAGGTTGTFTVTPSTCAARTITIATSTPGVVIGTGTGGYTGTCGTTDCPDDTGGTAQSATFGGAGACPPTASMTFTLTPAAGPQADLYRTTSPISILITI